ASSVGLALLLKYPFPSEDALLSLIRARSLSVYEGLHWTYTALLFTTPYVVSSSLLSFAYIFIVKQDRRRVAAKLPSYPSPGARKDLFVIVGEVHQPKRREPAAAPEWLAIPERGLYTGVAVFGAIGSGKTSCCMYPFA